MGSGYGLYKEDYNSDKYRKFKGSRAVFTTTDNSIHITESLDSSSFIETKNTQSANAYSIKVTGLKPGIALEYRYVLPDVEGLRTIAIVEDGVYNLPQTGNYFNGFRFTGYLGACNITIKQIPEYEGAIVTDGIDDYLKLDKVGYKIGTVILKYIPLFRDNNWRYVFDVTEERCYFASSKDSGAFVTSMYYKSVGDYTYLIPRTGNNPTVSNTPLYISSHAAMKELLSMALYEIAIYSENLTDEEIQKEIDVMQYDTPNPVFALNFDNFAYKAVDYPEFATGKVTTNKIVVNSTTATFNGIIATATNPEADTGEPIEVPAYKLKISGMDAYNMPEDFYFIAVLGANISGKPTQQWVQQFSKDGIYNIPAITLEDNIYNISIAAMIGLDKPIEIEVLYDKNITKSFPENKQIFP